MPEDNTALLKTRDDRQITLLRVLEARHPAVLFVSLNIPGREKTPLGTNTFFSWMMGKVSMAFPEAERLSASNDLLGPYAILWLDDDPVQVKRKCIELETAHPSARLIDLDVYSSVGEQIDRALLNLAARPCLVCEDRAVDCIRARRHNYDKVISRVHELLAPFRFGQTINP